MLKTEIENSKKMHGRKLLYKRDHLDQQGTNLSSEISKVNSNLLTCPLDFMTTYNNSNISRRKSVNLSIK